MPEPRSRVESLLGIPMPRRSMPAARRPAPANESSPPPVVERRAEQIEPEKSPATLAEPEMARVLIVDPGTQTIAEAKLPTEAGDAEAGYGVQLGRDAVVAILGDAVEWAEVGDGLAAMVVQANGEDEAADLAWRLGEGEVLTGRALVRGYDEAADGWIDAALTLDETREMIVWGADEEGEEEVALSYREQRAR